MKLLSLVVFALASAAGIAPAQVVFSDDFESGPLGQFQYEDYEAGGSFFAWDGMAATGDANYAGGAGNAATSNSDMSGEGEYDHAIVSPAIQLGSGSRLDFLTNYQNFTNADFADVDISVNNGPWQNLLHWNEDHGTFYNAPGESVSVDLSAYDHQSVRIRFHHYDPNSGDYDWYWQVDEVRITDGNAPSIWYADSDGDGYGDPAVSIQQPDQPPGYIALAGDCDDADPAINPGATETCNGIDDDCNGVIDDGGSLWYADADGDGYGDPGNTLMACAQPPGYVIESPTFDCDDTNPSIHPFATETCNNIDDNCDGLTDEGVAPVLWYADADGDGYGDPANTRLDCPAPPGYIATAGDCDDTNATVYPGATELCEGLDNDCDGQTDEGLGTTWYADADGDTWGDASSTIVACAQPGGYVAIAGDCDDTDAAVNPGATEVCGNSIDDNCDGQTDEGCCSLTFQPVNELNSGALARGVRTDDFDRDGNPDLVVVGMSTDSASIWLGNGDGTFKAPVGYALGVDPVAVALGDLDGDGASDVVSANYTSNNVSVLLGKTDGTFQAKSSAGVGTSPFSIALGDFDGDGRLDAAVANSVSNNVSVLLGKGDGTFKTAVNYSVGTLPWSVATDDFNNDGKLDLVVANLSSDTVSVLLGNGNGTFQTAVGYAAVDPTSVTTSDLDGDGKPDLVVTNEVPNTVSILRGNANGTFQAAVTYPCGPRPYTAAVGDFNGDGRSDLAVSNYFSSSISVLPGAGNGTFQSSSTFAFSGGAFSLTLGDFDRDGRTDLASANFANNTKTLSILLNSSPGSMWYPDLDADGYGDSSSPRVACLQPVGYIAIGGDCDDADAAIHPGATEICDGKDNDCDGTPDDGLTMSTWYPDADGDSFGDAANSVQACSQPSGYIATAGDCDDTNAAINPNATETCDGLDNNCNGQADEGLGQMWYGDRDGDGYGDASNTLIACAQPNGYVANSGDCDDTNGTVYPGATEVCDGLDNDCDGQTDEGLGTTWYRDFDADGYGDSAIAIVACAQPGGYIAQGGDCNDGSASVYPGAPELCDGLDNDCDGKTDEGVGSTWYADADGDTYGDAGRSTVACAQPGGYVADDTDCDDADPAINPGVFEVCDNGIDDNCDGQVDEGCCPVTFQAAINHGAGDYPTSAAVSDFNQDGLPDLAVSNAGGNNVSILLANPNGSFKLAVNYNVLGDPESIAVADFNADGRPDLAVANGLNDNISILRGNADGTFQAALNYSVGTGPVSVAVADFNGDGRPDLVSANSVGDNVSILLAKANGAFVAAGHFPAGNGPASVAVGDFNGDGRPDLAVADHDADGVSVLLGEPKNSFKPAVAYPTGASPIAVAVADFNGDGRPDLTVANAGIGRISILRGNANGTFQPAVNYIAGFSPYFVAAADVTNDGRPDAVVADGDRGRVAIMRSNPDGSLQAPVSFTVGNLPLRVALGDFDRDGRLDLAVPNFLDGNVSILRNLCPIEICGNGLDDDCDDLIDELVNPIITQNPSPRTVNLGETAHFGVTSIGGTAWQWRKNGIPIIGASGQFYSIIGVQESHAGLYSVIVYNNCGQATSASAALTVQPAAPSVLTGSEGSKGSVKLTWTDNSTLETGFEVWRAAFSGGTWGNPTLVAILGANTTSYSQSPGVGVWRYRIRAKAGNLFSAWTPFEAIKPAAPSGLTLQKLQPGKAKLTWTDNSNFEASFTIERQKFNGLAWGSTTTLPTQGANTTTYTDTPGTGKYRYRIRASNVAGNSVWVGWVSVNL